MKKVFLLLGGMTSISLLAASFQIPQNAPVYRAIRKHEAQIEQQTTPPSPTAHRQFNRTEVRQEAQELERLAGTIPYEVGRVGQGLEPKELGERLKRIEKLSKRLRSQLAL